VPLDAVASSGATLNLTVSRLAATNPARRIGSLVVNPGGPGLAATDFIRDADKSGLISKEIRARFDIVGFDPPGVGLAIRFRCSESADRAVPATLQPRTPAELASLVAGAKDLASRCGRYDAAILPHMGVEDVARDLDAVRAALGDAKLTYVGFSYGSLIGATSAALFPDRIRALVLDGPVDPSLDLFALARARRWPSRPRWPFPGRLRRPQLVFLLLSWSHGQSLRRPHGPDRAGADPQRLSGP
jgi:pimeloyl-ACP methyl ester carboxylesterase